MKLQSGFIFIVTLCITAVMSLLLLSSMHHILLYQRAIAQQEQRHQRFYQLEHVSRYLLALPLKQLAQCTLKQDLANAVILQVGKNPSCSFNAKEQQYHYLVEDLGSYPCLVAQHQGRLSSTHHFRFTLLAQQTQEHPALLVQIRIIKSAKLLFCANEVTHVALGISSWRYLDNML